jgi:TM2 domain-containing membrane protein YozV
MSNEPDTPDADTPPPAPEPAPAATPDPAPAPAPTPAGGKSEKKLIAGILGVSSIIWGGFGVHKFYLGYTKEGIIQLVLTLLCGIGAIIGLIEGIIYLTKSDEEFDAIYVKGQKPWF